MKILLFISLIISSAAFADWDNDDVYSYSKGCFETNHERRPNLSIDSVIRYCDCTLERFLAHFDKMPATLNAEQHAFIVEVSETCSGRIR